MEPLSSKGSSKNVEIHLDLEVASEEDSLMMMTMTSLVEVLEDRA